MVAVMTTGVILPPDWLIMKKVAIPAEFAIMATFMKQGQDQPLEPFKKNRFRICFSVSVHNTEPYYM